MKSYRRADRVSSLIQEILADVLRSSVKDPRTREAVITGVSLGDDLKIATVYYRVVDLSGRDAVQKGLDSARGFLRRELARRLDIKSIPELAFTYDDAVDRAERIEAILKDIKS